MMSSKNVVWIVCFSFLCSSILSGSAMAALAASLYTNAAAAPQQARLSVNTNNNCNPQLADTSMPDLALFDAHTHITPSYNAGFVVSEMNNAGVEIANLYPIAGDTDSTSQSFVAQYPGRFVTFVSLPDYPQNSQWLKDGEAYVSYVKAQLETGKFYGIGEVNLRYYDNASYTPPPAIYVPPDNELMLQIVNLSATYHVPISFHFVPDNSTDNVALQHMLSYNKNATFIWAHLGFNNMPLNISTLNDYLLRYPNLYLDTAGIQNMMNEPPGAPNSNWNIIVNQNSGRLNPAWQHFFDTWNSRILWGSDAGGGNDMRRWLNYANNAVQGVTGNAVGHWRHALAVLDQNAVHNIFSANAKFVLLKQARPAYNYSVASSNGQCTTVLVHSNSSISSLSFDVVANKLTFEAADSNGTSNYAVVSIPTSLIDGTFSVEVNGKNAPFTKTFNSTYNNIKVGYGGGIDTIAVMAMPEQTPPSAITSTGAVPANSNQQTSSQNWAPIMVVGIVIIIAVAAYSVMRKQRHK